MNLKCVWRTDVYHTLLFMGEGQRPSWGFGRVYDTHPWSGAMCLQGMVTLGCDTS